MANNKLLEVVNLQKIFQTSQGPLHAVDDVSFFVKKGETLGLVGESGCGKSTTGRLIVRLLTPTSGRILFDGEDINTYNKKELKKARRNIQMVFQDPFSSLNPRMNVAELIKESFEIHSVYKREKERDAKLGEIMEVVGLSQRLVNSYPHELDGGRRQRVGIARAIALNPSFIVLDEPVSALDVSVQAQILNLLDRLQKEFGLTYLFIAHDLSVVKHVSDVIAVMYVGKMVERSDYKSIFKNPLHPYTRALISAIPTPNLKKKKDRIILEGDVPSPINPGPGCRFYPRCWERLPLCKEVEPELREVASGHFVACHNVESSP